MKKLNFEKVTPELEKTAKQFADKMIAEYLSVESTKKQEQLAEEKLRKFFKIAKWDFPEKIIWLDSPLDKEYISAIDRTVDGTVDRTVCSIVGSTVYSIVDRAVDRAVGNAVGSTVSNAMDRAVGGALYSLYWANRFSFFEFFHTYWKKNDLHPMAEFTRLANGVVIVKDTMYLFRHPDILSRDTEGRLHSETGMAYRFRNGDGFYFYHGVKIFEKIIKTPQKLTKEV